MRYSLAIFDWDGTLMDSTHTIVAAIQAACRDMGLPVPGVAQASWVIGLSLDEALHRAVPDLTPSQLPRFLERYRIHYLLRDPDLRTFDGIIDMLNTLKAEGVLMAVATGKSRVGLDRVLTGMNLGTILTPPALRTRHSASHTRECSRKFWRNWPCLPDRRSWWAIPHMTFRWHSRRGGQYCGYVWGTQHRGADCQQTYADCRDANAITIVFAGTLSKNGCLNFQVANSSLLLSFFA